MLSILRSGPWGRKRSRTLPMFTQPARTAVRIWTQSGLWVYALTHCVKIGKENYDSRVWGEPSAVGRGGAPRAEAGVPRVGSGAQVVSTWTSRGAGWPAGLDATALLCEAGFGVYLQFWTPSQSLINIPDVGDPAGVRGREVRVGEMPLPWLLPVVGTEELGRFPASGWSLFFLFLSLFCFLGL